MKTVLMDGIMGLVIYLTTHFTVLNWQYWTLGLTAVVWCGIECKEGS